MLPGRLYPALPLILPPAMHNDSSFEGKSSNCNQTRKVYYENNTTEAAKSWMVINLSATAINKTSKVKNSSKLTSIQEGK